MNTSVEQDGAGGAEVHPRPLLQRKGWIGLDGPWDFALDENARFRIPSDVEWSDSIVVPFSPETPASGVGATGFFRACWYRRTFDAPVLERDERLILHFGAVDYFATVWVNGKMAAVHEGGYTPFSADVTELLDPSGPQVVVVRAEDDPHDLAKPRGKQDWQLEPHSIWYPRTTGIWRTVWLERVGATRIGTVRWTPNLARWEIAVEVKIEGVRRDDLCLDVELTIGTELLARDRYTVVSGDVQRRIALSDPGIDDYRNELLWSPVTPTLIDAKIELRAGDEILDSVESYTALRSIGIEGDRFILNGRPYFLRMVLDQGYWPETGLTPPDSDALRRDVELAKAMGFNGVRKHQKIEDPRFLYWADHLGLVVWEEMPSAYRYTRTSVERLTRQWAEVIDRDSSHPSIVAWVPFNESWGVPDLPDSPAQRHCVQALYHLTRSLDPTRPVIGNDGWESVATDIIGIHDYTDRPELISERYGSAEGAPRLFRRERPGGRMIVLDGVSQDQPIMLTEFGGITFSQETGTWGYVRVESANTFEQRYTELLHVVRSLPLLAGFCYTQFTDTYQEANGLLYADRTAKFPIARIALATRGPRSARDLQVELAWRERMMDVQKNFYRVRQEDHRIAGSP